MKPEFVEIKTKDGLALPGLYYTEGKSKAVAIFLHGNGSSSVFYDGEDNLKTASILAEKGIASLYFNNRGAHIIKKIYAGHGRARKKKRFGMAYEQIKECVEDIDGALAFARKCGIKTTYLVGESTGANKICVYNYYKPKNSVSAYALLAGGDDVGIYYNLLGPKKFHSLLSLARKRIKEKRGEEIMPEMLPDNIFSYQGFYDIGNPDGDYNTFPFYEVINNVKLSKKPLWRHLKSIKKPALVVYGDRDEYAWGDVPRIVNILKKENPAPRYEIIRGADHGFHGKEKNLAHLLAFWFAGGK
ncbi:alpha/beta hydrolase [bacterium]|nr:alpha/beta hydrolase [bacterium]MCI0566477.1 alpha/beta hydrolase [bacterium]MCI0680170.1 alpha/beta hydrolase [bacterium]